MRGVINAEHVYATARSHRAAFDSVGRVEQTESRAAVRFFNARHEFSGFAQALLSSGRDLVRFMWIDDDKSWYAVRIDAETRPDDSVRALVSTMVTQPPFGLTIRELDVLTLLSGGLGNREIAACLEMSLRTVTTHVERILVKLSQMSRTGAATLATDLGLLRLPTPGGGRNLAPLTAGLVDLKSPWSPAQRKAFPPPLRGARSLSGCHSRSMGWRPPTPRRCSTARISQSMRSTGGAAWQAANSS